MPEHNVSTSSMTNVLIIDDETQIRKFLDIALRAQGYKPYWLKMVKRA
jgi:two-component system KDP operon response regulator KdpE